MNSKSHPYIDPHIKFAMDKILDTSALDAECVVYEKLISRGFTESQKGEFNRCREQCRRCISQRLSDAIREIIASNCINEADLLFLYKEIGVEQEDLEINFGKVYFNFKWLKEANANLEKARYSEIEDIRKGEVKMAARELINNLTKYLEGLDNEKNTHS